MKLLRRQVSPIICLSMAGIVLTIIGHFRSSLLLFVIGLICCSSILCVLLISLFKFFSEVCYRCLLFSIVIPEEGKSPRIVPDNKIAETEKDKAVEQYSDKILSNMVPSDGDIV
jgi:hypothetical protein